MGHTPLEKKIENKFYKTNLFPLFQFLLHNSKSKTKLRIMLIIHFFVYFNLFIITEINIKFLIVTFFIHYLNRYIFTLFKSSMLI